MLRLTLRGLWSRKLRTALTFVVVMPGVSLMAGTLVLTDTIRKTFGHAVGGEQNDRSGVPGVSDELCIGVI